MIKVLIARLATIGLAYTVANAVKAGTGLTDDHQDGNDYDDDGDEDEDEMKFSPFFHPCPSPPCLAKGQTFANLFDLFLKQCSEKKLFHFTFAPVSAGSIYKKESSVCLFPFASCELAEGDREVQNDGKRILRRPNSNLC